MGWEQSEGLGARGAVSLPHNGAQGGALVLRAGEEGEGRRPAFSWCPAVPGRGSSPERHGQRGGLPGPLRRLEPRAQHKAGGGWSRARPTRRRSRDC